jgi:hypothetical protein
MRSVGVSCNGAFAFFALVYVLVVCALEVLGFVHAKIFIALSSFAVVLSACVSILGTLLIIHSLIFSSAPHSPPPDNRATAATADAPNAMR